MLLEKKTSLAISLLFFNALAHAGVSKNDDDILSSILISEISSTGTAINNGKSMYMKRFTLSIINTGRESVDLATGCYYATNKENTIKIKPKVFNPALRTKINPGINGSGTAGDIEFVSFDKSIYDIDFVRWTSDCQFMNEKNVLNKY